MVANPLSKRPATQADIPFLLALRRETMDQHLEASGASTADACHMERLLYRFDCAQVLLDGGVPVGLIKVCSELACWEIVQIQLGRQLQGRGLGRSILESIIAEARLAGADVSLSVLKANPARHLYARLGFQVTGETEHEYRMLLRP